MRVLLISHTCQSPSEGQPKAERLAQMPGIDLRVVIPDRWMHYGHLRQAHIMENAVCAYQVERVALPWAGPAQYYMHWYPRLAALLREFQPDIIDLWEEPWNLLSAHVCRLRQRLLPQARIVVETEQNINKTLPFPFEACRAYTLRHADYVVGRSSEAIQVLRSKGYNGPARVVPNAVDASVFRPLDRGACRRDLGLSGFVAGYVGRLVEEKGLMDMIEALALCPPDVQMLFVGDGPYKPALEHRANALGKGGQVRFFPARPSEQLPAIMNALDALVLVSRTTRRWKEQFGRVIIEAQACQIPVIGSMSGAIPEVLGEAGLLVPERTPPALADAIARLQSDAALRRHLGERGRAQVEQRCTWEQVARQMRDIYVTMMPPRSLERSLEAVS